MISNESIVTPFDLFSIDMAEFVDRERDIFADGEGRAAEGERVEFAGGICESF